MSVSVRFPKDLHDELKRQAELRGVSINWLVNRAIELWLDEHYPQPERDELVAEWRIRHGKTVEEMTLPIESQDDVDKIVESLYEMLMELRGTDGSADPAR